MYTASIRYMYMAEDAHANGLGTKIKTIAHGRWPAEAIDALLREQPAKANVVADIRERVLAEQQRIKGMEAARARVPPAQGRGPAGNRRPHVHRVRRLDEGRRADALVCSTKCRMRGHRHMARSRAWRSTPTWSGSRAEGRCGSGRTLRQRNDLAMAVLQMSAESAELIRRQGAEVAEPRPAGSRAGFLFLSGAPKPEPVPVILLRQTVSVPIQPLYVRHVIRLSLLCEGGLRRRASALVSWRQAGGEGDLQHGRSPALPNPTLYPWIHPFRYVTLFPR